MRAITFHEALDAVVAVRFQIAVADLVKCMERGNSPPWVLWTKLVDYIPPTKNRSLRVGRKPAVPLSFFAHNSQRTPRSLGPGLLLSANYGTQDPVSHGTRWSYIDAIADDLRRWR
jgi:hypothetical protein